jgi:hypothetical protein
VTDESMVEEFVRLHPEEMATARAIVRANSEELRHQLWMARRDVFVEVISDYERLRGYLAIRYNDLSNNSDVAQWLSDNGHGLFIEGVPEADRWRNRFWPDPRYFDSEGYPLSDDGELTDEDVDEMVQHQYEDALGAGDEWAEEAYAYRSSGEAPPEV